MAREVTQLSRDDRNDPKRKSPLQRISLESIEQGLGRAIERPFSRVFRSALQPAEIERACVREVEKSRRLGVSTVYVANVYYVVISQRDEESLGDLIETLESDLSARLYAYAANNRYEMVTRPIVSFLVDDDFKLGDLLVYGEHLSEHDVSEEFGIDFSPRRAEADIAALRGPSPVAAPSPAVIPQAAAVPAPSWEPIAAAAAAASPETSPTPWLQDAGPAGGPVPVTMPVPGRLIAGIAVSGRPPMPLHRGMRYTIGRQEGCDVVIADAQISRVHATIEGDGNGWYITDRGSTNGTLVNRVAITHQQLRNGDTIRIGDVDIAYGESWVDDKNNL